MKFEVSKWGTLNQPCFKVLTVCFRFIIHIYIINALTFNQLPYVSVRVNSREFILGKRLSASSGIYIYFFFIFIAVSYGREYFYNFHSYFKKYTPQHLFFFLTLKAMQNDRVKSEVRVETFCNIFLNLNYF